MSTMQNYRPKRPNCPGGQHASSVGTSTKHETIRQWRARVNHDRQHDGLEPLSDDTLAKYEACIRRGNVLAAVKIEQSALAAAFESARAAAATQTTTPF